MITSHPSLPTAKGDFIEQHATYTAKPFLKWVGGKTQLLDELAYSITTDFQRMQATTYVEPFIGGGAFFFWIMQTMRGIRHAVINDINEDLIKTYTTVQQHPAQLILALRKMQDAYLPLSHEARTDYYLHIREKYNTKQSSDVCTAAMLIFLNRTCFNGLYRVNSKGAFNVPHGRYLNPKICDAETIMADHNVLQGVTILCGDFQQTLRYADTHTLFYLDPPYKPVTTTAAFTSYDKEGFDDRAQGRLHAFCDSINSRGSKFILSNSDVRSQNGDPFFDNLYDTYWVRRVQATRMVNCNAAKRGKINELLITNFHNKAQTNHE